MKTNRNIVFSREMSSSPCDELDFQHDDQKYYKAECFVDK